MITQYSDVGTAVDSVDFIIWKNYRVIENEDNTVARVWWGNITCINCKENFPRDALLQTDFLSTDYITSHHIHIMSHHITSHPHHVTPHHIHIMSHHITSHPHHVTSHHITVGSLIDTSLQTCKSVSLFSELHDVCITAVRDENSEV
jgi:hypothetical protein